jgi:DNA-binding transcriptional regulator GbsR (MarR family)
MCSCWAVAPFARSRAISAQSPVPPPPLPRREPGDREDPASPPPGAKKAVLEQNQKDIKKDVEKLYELASELKTEVDKTDATAVLSLAMVKKAEEIEKLAKQIKDHAKG